MAFAFTKCLPPSPSILQAMNIIQTITSLVTSGADAATIDAALAALRADGCDDLTIAGALDIVYNQLLTH